MQTIRWGILGCGDVTELKSGPAFNKVPGSELIAVMRRDADAAADYAQRHGVPKWYADANDLIQDPDVDAVYIATPPSSHMELALAVAAAGKPCYVEKPMACSSVDCEKMVAAFETANCPLFVAYYRRSHPHFQRVQAIIDTGELGALHQLTYDYSSGGMLEGSDLSGWRYQPDISGGGLFWDLGSHALDLFDYWTGPFQRVQGQVINLTGRTKVEEMAQLTAQSPSGVGVSATWNFMSTERTDVVTLRFEAGVLRCSIFGAPILEIVDSNGVARVESFELPENTQYHLIANTVAAMRGEADAWSTGASALRTNQVMDVVAQSEF